MEIDRVSRFVSGNRKETFLVAVNVQTYDLYSNMNSHLPHLFSHAEQYSMSLRYLVMHFLKEL